MEVVQPLPIEQGNGREAVEALETSRFDAVDRAHRQRDEGRSREA